VKLGAFVMTLNVSHVSGNPNNLLGNKNSALTTADARLCWRFFLVAHGLVRYESTPGGRTVNKEMFVEIFRRLRDALRRKRQEEWHETDSFFCMKTHWHIGRWRSKCTKPSTM
jgi:hypothetical protein